MSIADKLATIAANEQRVYDAGKAAQEKAFWDTYQSNGSRIGYQSAFAGYGWTSATFKPRHNMAPKDAYMMFRESRISGDLVSILQGLGVTLDFSNTTNMPYLFQNSMFTRIGVVDASKAAHLTGVFLNMHNLVTIDKLIVSDTRSVAFSDTFGTCEKLQNITVEGVIGQNVNLSLCPLLTHDSIINIISCLQDLTGTGNTRTLTLGATNLAKLTDAEKAVATEKGWTLA